MINEQQFEFFFRGNFATMCNFAYSIVKDSDQAHDIVQQAFVNIWERRDEIDENVNLPSYLRRAIVNVSINHIQKQKRIQIEGEYTQVQLDSAATADSGDYLQGEVEEAVKRAVEQLPEKSQLVFSLSRFQGMSNKEIADSLNISIKAVEKHIGKSLKELRVSLAPYLKIFVIFSLTEVGYRLAKLFL
jgi:RNA polymerase sigma-70 factor (ECF subfamily)